MRRWAFILAATLVLSTAGFLHATEVSLIKIDGAIGPATASYVERAVQIAGKREDECLIIQLDTPGGLMDSMEKIVDSFYSSKVPTVIFVSPTGTGSATSAGCFITMAADIAAMAPFTRIGAAHPVMIGSTGNLEKMDDTMKTKVENDAASLIEGIANKRHRNVEWARAAVLESTNVTAEQALDLNIIDLIAKDMPDLLKQLDGRKVGDKTLHTEDAKVVDIPMSTWERFSQIFLRPEIMFALMLVVIYGIIGELSSPGAILPGVAGAIALILVLYMSSVLPINIAGVALILLAVALFIVDIYAPTHGVLTGGGIVAFFLGSLMLFNHAAPGFQLSLGYIIPATLLTAAFFVFIVSAGLRAQFQPVKAGKETMIGQTAEVLSRIDAHGGKVFIEGEYWNAVSEATIEMDQAAEVIGIEGLTLKVKPKTKQSKGENYG